MKIFRVTKKFFWEDMFGLIDQVKRSLRSVCANITDGNWISRSELHFISKMNNGDMEESETQFLPGFALAGKYITNDYNKLADADGRLIAYMKQHTHTFLPKADK